MQQQKKFRHTKIIATIGPACDDIETLVQMIEAGMSVARLNLSHGDYEQHRQTLNRVHQAAAQCGRRIAIMIDTRGIEIRTGKLKSSHIELLPGDAFVLSTDDRLGDLSGVAVSYAKLPGEVSVGDMILLDDGAIELSVEKISHNDIFCRIEHGGILKDNKGVNLPNTHLSMTAVGPEIRDDVIAEMRFAAENDVDYIAASFIQSAEDIEHMRQILQDLGANTPIIAKIENRAGLENLDEVVAASDGIMVARGDLGVELPFGEVPGAQKKLIRSTVMAGKPVITATQMLASMEFNPRPTRAEASDVANAVLDGTSAIMLSGETAMGKYPVETIETMNQLALTAEACLNEYGYLQAIPFHSSNVVTEAVADSVAGMANKLKPAAIVSLTETGFTSRLISKHRPDCPIIAITSKEQYARRLSMNWGVEPMVYDTEIQEDSRMSVAIQSVVDAGYAKAGDTLIITTGHNQKRGGTDMIRVVTV